MMNTMARQGAMSVEDLILHKVATLRRWKKTKLYKSRSKWDFKFTIMTYNILSQNAAENHRYLYKNCHPALFHEDYRISKIMPEILRSGSDIICLQEVEQTLFHNRMREIFDSNGFASVFKSRTGSKSDGCAIIWRKAKFNLVRHKSIEFRSKSNKLLDRDNIGLIAVLKPNHPKFRNLLLHVATTHLLYNPKRGDIKLCQLRWLFAELERLSLKEVKGENRHYHPVIFCGDLNVEPFSPLYQFIETGCIDVMNALSGDLSGQAKGKSKGPMVDDKNLLLHNLGISDASRFEDIPSKGEKSDGSEETGSNCQHPAVNEENSPNCIPSSSGAIDASLLKAIGNSNDPRWIATLLALGQKELAAELSAQLPNDQKLSKTSNQSLSNSQPTSDSETKETKLCFYHDFKFVPAYKYHRANQKSIPITSMTGGEFNNVDHIFYSVDKKRDIYSYTEGPLRLLSVYSLMFAEEVMELGGLPNAGLGSDHICLMATFAINSKK